MHMYDLRFWDKQIRLFDGLISLAGVTRVVESVKACALTVFGRSPTGAKNPLT